MIREIRIDNYKSIKQLKLNLGRVTVLIGENGCGKTNILEGIALVAAAASDRLDNEFLNSRGIRVTEPQLMRSGFEANQGTQNIKISLSGDNKLEFSCSLQNDNKPYSQWINRESKKLHDTVSLLNFLDQKYQNLGGSSEEYKSILRRFLQKQQMLDKLSDLQRFVVYSPQKQELRTFEKEEQLQPLGIHGEGLFKLLTVLNSHSNQTKLEEIKQKLKLISWFEDFTIPSNLSPNERKIAIKDKFLDANLAYFDQKSANEGFLFLLFYFTLFISKETPTFFAIDNIDASLHPKLCSQLIKELVQLAVKNNKQVIVTAHNPAILTGLDLDNDEQRIVVVYRNNAGHTQTKRILKPKTAEAKKKA
ncbi:MAG: AAA family ATPase, partial [Spirulinaceae cyanobacterium]